MPLVLAICDANGHPFSSGMSIAAGVVNATLIGNKAGPCPVCGSTGTIPDGVYDAVGGVISRIALSGASIGEFRALHRLLEEPQNRSAETIADDIDAISPKFNSLANLLRSTALKQLLIGVLIIVLAGLILDTVREPPSTTINETHIHIDADTAILRIAESAQSDREE